MVNFIIALVVIEKSLDLYISVDSVSIEITYHTNGNSSFSERNKGDVAKFHEPVRKPRRLEMKSDKDIDGLVGD